MSQLDLSTKPAATVTSSELSASALHDKCLAIASNLWWTWQPEVNNLFRDIDPIRWRQLDHNPIALLRELSPERLAQRASEMVLYSRINHAFRQLKEYTANKQTWGATHAGVLGARPVAYFSAEFGIHESLPIYSGGLGVLSGDHIKSASGLGVPLVAVGLFYDQGYFRQRLDEAGYQVEEYQDTKVENLPIEPAISSDGKPIMVSLQTRQETLLAKVWKMLVGRVELYLLDCDVEGNSPQDRHLTSRLYGGDERTRIRQELVLGVGGVRALRALGITPGAYHLNEGHSAFGPLEVVRQSMQDEAHSFDHALRETAQRTVFTTHTPVPAGHDRFDGDLVEEHLGPLRDELGISYEQLMGLGRVEPQNEHESFCMTVVGLKLSRRANAVSSLHGHVSRRMWAHLWPWRVEEEIPIGHITNGVHVPSWLAWQMRQLYDRILPANWIQRMGEAEVWQHIQNVDPGELWETHNALKNLLLVFTRRRLSRQSRRRGESDAAVDAARNVLDPNILTIGFGRRFATYKRANLLFQDLDRLCALLHDSERPIQLIFAGKAHPKDEPGKKLIQEIANSRHNPRFNDRIVFIEDYDVNVCRHMIQGVDVWLNNPRRPLEASGTSGQKVVLNGGLNLSILDGWWAEAYNGENGFAIGNGTQHVSDEITDQRDAENLYNVLEGTVIPMFYDRDDDGLPKAWIQRMMNSIGTLAWRFSAHRMLMDYARTCYVPAAGGLSCDMNFR
ncbi:MAG: alpha-glucan family phosphorylase [Pirellulaceae bacterium]|nr:alpha-glucan family phosphorylase [Pirellulaceae bacterium]